MAINGLVQLLVYILIGGLIVYAVVWILSLLTLPPPVRTIISVIVALFVLLWLLGTLGILPGLHL